MIKIFYEGNKKVAVVEFEQVDIKGKPDKQGEYIYVRNAFIDKTHRSLLYLRQIIKKCAKEVNAKYAYFKRKKYKNRLSEVYPIHLLTRS